MIIFHQISRLLIAHFFLSISGSTVARCLLLLRDVIKIQNHKSVSFFRRPDDDGVSQPIDIGRVTKNYYFGGSGEREMRLRKKIVGGIQHDIQIWRKLFTSRRSERTRKKNCVYIWKQHTIHWPIWSAWRVVFFIQFLSFHTLFTQSECDLKKRVPISTFCHLMNTFNKPPSVRSRLTTKKIVKIIILNCDDNTPSSDDRSLQVLTLEKCSIDEWFFFANSLCVFSAHLSSNLQSSISSLFCVTPITQPSDISS